MRDLIMEFKTAVTNNTTVLVKLKTTIKEIRTDINIVVQEIQVVKKTSRPG